MTVLLETKEKMKQNNPFRISHHHHHQQAKQKSVGVDRLIPRNGMCFTQKYWQSLQPILT